MNQSISAFPKKINNSISKLTKTENEYYKKAENIEKDYFKLLDTLNKSRTAYLKDFQIYENLLTEKEQNKETNFGDIEDVLSTVHTQISEDQAREKARSYQASVDASNSKIPDLEDIFQKTSEKYLIFDKEMKGIFQESKMIFLSIFKSNQEILTVLEKKIPEYSESITSKEMNNPTLNYSLKKPPQNIFIPYEIQILKKDKNESSKGSKYYDRLVHTVVVNFKALFPNLAPEVRLNIFFI